MYRRLLRFVRPYWKKMAIAMVCMTLTAGLNSSIAYMVKPVLDDIFINKRWIMLKLLPIALLILYLLKGTFTYIQGYLMMYIGEKVVMSLRGELFAHVHSLSMDFFTKRSTGLIMARINNDVGLVQRAITHSLADLLREPLDIIGFLAVMFYCNWFWAILSVLVLPFVALLISKMGLKLRRISGKVQQKVADLNVILHETLSGALIVKAFHMEEREVERYRRENQRFFNEQMRAGRVAILSTPLMELLASFGIAFIVWFGGAQVIAGKSTPGNFFSFMTALLMMYSPIKKLTHVNNDIQHGIAASQRIFEFLDAQPSVREAEDAVEMPPLRQSIEYRDVSFRYEKQPVLQNINLRVSRGEIIAIVGTSGAGKTTLVSLLPRFYEATSGDILIDGQDIKKATLRSLRQQIGIVTQETILFNDTVRNNILYGRPDAGDAEVIEAAKAALAHDFISQMPDGYDARIGERGVKLSGGQKQRIAIARAILKNPAILILDEATSSLDSKSEALVQQALDNLMQDRTTFIIAHRLSTVRGAHRIVVLNQGRIQEIGDHVTLLAQKGIYAHLYQTQFATQEPLPLPSVAQDMAACDEIIS
ncbi:MAG: ABC transporter ATP-binding protein [bacterium]